MAFALCCLMGCWMALNAVYSLPIDDKAVSCRRTFSSAWLLSHFCVFLFSSPPPQMSDSKTIQWKRIKKLNQSSFATSTVCAFIHFSCFSSFSRFFLFFPANHRVGGGGGKIWDENNLRFPPTVRRVRDSRRSSRCLSLRFCSPSHLAFMRLSSAFRGGQKGFHSWRAFCGWRNKSKAKSERTENH